MYTVRVNRAKCQVVLDQEQIETLQRLAEEKKLSRSAVLRMALDHGIREIERIDRLAAVA